MEEPLADTFAGAEQLVHRAAARGVVLQGGHVERFNRAVRAAAPYLDEPRFLQIDRLAPFQPRGTDVAVILDLMIHDLDRKSTRLNSSHSQISYAVFCLKKKKKKKNNNNSITV